MSGGAHTVCHADGSDSIERGNIMRCLALADALRNRRALLPSSCDWAYDDHATGADATIRALEQGEDHHTGSTATPSCS